MNRTVLALGIIFLLVVMSFTSISGNQIDNDIVVTSNMGNILYVGGSGEGNYTKIQDAIDDAVDGDTVFVYDDSSPYFEGNILINKAINLIGEDRDTTIIDGKYHWVIINNVLVGANISGFTIRNGHFYGIGVSWGNSIRIYDNNIFNCDIGIQIYNSQYCSIISNTFKNCNDSIENHDNDYIRISDNIIKGWSTPQTFYNGEIECFDNYKSIISNNTIINYNEEGYICLYVLRTRDCIIKNNTIKRYGTAITMQNGCYNNIISQNNIINNGYGIGFNYFSGFNKIINNNFINNTQNAGSVLLSFNNFFDSNYWDDWIGVRFPLPILQKFPKIIFGGFSLGIDWHPAKEPYNFTNIQGCGIE